MKIIIIYDETTEEHEYGICENCKQYRKIRSIQSVGHMNEERGYFDICFHCTAPRLFWKRRDDTAIFETPQYLKKTKTPL